MDLKEIEDMINELIINKRCDEIEELLETYKEEIKEELYKIDNILNGD